MRLRRCSCSTLSPKQLEGALVTIDVMGCQATIADKNVDHLLALKGQPAHARKPTSPITSVLLCQNSSSARGN